MKTTFTSLMRMTSVMMLLLTLTFLSSPSAKADCGFSLSSRDSAWTFSAHAGSTQTRTFTITNTSGGSLTLNFSFTGSSDFSVPHKEITLANGDTTSVTITFAPGSTESGNVYSKLTITKSGTDCRQDLGLAGSIIANSTAILVADPHEYNFGAVAVGTQVCKEVKITNTSNGTVLNFAMGSLSCDNGVFTVTSIGVSTLAPGASTTVTVCFTPKAAGATYTCSWTDKFSTLSGDGSITFSFSGSGATGNHDTTKTVPIVADPHEFNLGTVAFGSSACKDVVVTNKSNDPVIIASWSKCDNADFSVTPGFSVADTLAAGSSMTFTICYKPHEANLTASCSLVLKYITTGSQVSDGAVTISFAANSTANTNGDKVCLHSEQGANYQDAVVIGGSADHTLYLINNSNFDITVNKADITGDYATYFAVKSTLPITVPAHTTNTLFTYTFSPTSATPAAVKAIVTFTLGGDSLQCETSTGVVVGYVVHTNTTSDSTVRPLFPTEKRTLGIEGNGKKVSTTFTFTNNLGVDATVNKVYLADGTYFTISSMTPAQTPFVLHPGANLTVIVSYTATDNLVHHDQLMIDADHQLQSTSFDLQGVQLAAGVAATLPSGVAINVSPNPTSSYLTVDMAGVNSADIQVYDLLGKEMTSAKASTTWKWNASNIVAGSYIVRVSGRSLSGEQFVASKRVIVTK